jgi:hypothetical protein
MTLFARDDSKLREQKNVPKMKKKKRKEEINVSILNIW